MSFSLSGTNPIASYLSIVRDEGKEVAAYVKSDPPLQRTEAAFQQDTVDISSSTDLLKSKYLPALQVVLGASNLGTLSTETGLLRQLLVQDPTSAKSLVQKTGNTNYLDFVRSMSARSTVSLGFGDGSADSFVTTGAAASTLSLRNLHYNSNNSALTAAAPAQAWTYVLDDGSAGSQIAASLTALLQATGTAGSPVTGSYSAGAGGGIDASSGAPAVTTSKDNAGNTVYSVVLAKDATGRAIRTASVIGVNAADSALAVQPGTITAAKGTSLLAAALTATGFSVSQSGTTGLSLVNPATNNALSIAPDAYSNFAGTTQQPVTKGQFLLPLGRAGLALSAGQILLSGGVAVGTVASVDSIGDVMLKAGSAINLSAGARMDVAVGAGVTGIGVRLTATASTAAGNQVSLGPQGARLQAGETLTDDGSVLGIVASADADGTVHLTGNLAMSVTAGDTIGVIPKVTTGNTPALQVASNAASVLSQHNTNQFEANEGKQVPGLGDALYFSRVAPTITSVNQLMSDTTLLRVVTTNLGLQDTFSNLPFDQQVSLLTAKVDFKQFSTPAKVQGYAEQYLALTNEQASADQATALAASLFSTSTSSDDNTPDLLSVLYPTEGSSTVSVLSLFGGDSGADGSSGTVSLFA